MDSNCSHHRLPPLDPAIDPAYADGPPPRPHRPQLTGTLDPPWPVSRLPPALQCAARVSLETLEDVLEREAQREERD